MKRLLFVALALACFAGTASAQGLGVRWTMKPIPFRINRAAFDNGGYRDSVKCSK